MKQGTPVLLVLALIFMGWFTFMAGSGSEGGDSDAPDLEDRKSETAKIVDIIRTILAPEPLRGQIEPQESNLTVSGIIDQTNRFRREHGLAPLQPDRRLHSAALSKLQDMLSQNYFAHQSPSGIVMEFWVDQSGYRYAVVGENLALGNFKDDEQLVQGWMDSPGHRENILKPAFTEIGVAIGDGTYEGVPVRFAVQLLARPASACPQVDQQLEIEIVDLQNELEAVEQELKASREELQQTKPAGRTDQEEADKYNTMVKAYNRLVARHKELAEDLKEKTAEYNEQVEEFNACAGG